MPSCAPASCAWRSRTASSAAAAPVSVPSFAIGWSRETRLASSANSMATKKPLAISRTTAAMRKPAVIPDLLLRGRSDDPDGRDAQALHRDDLEPPAVDRAHVAGRRDLAESIEHESGQRLVLPLGHLEAGQVPDLVGMQRRRDDGGPHRLDPGQRRGDLVVLVVDLADELLEDVLERDDAGGAAVLVDDDRQLLSALAEFDQQLVEVARLGHREHRRHQLDDLGRSPSVDRHAVDGLDVDDTDEIVEAVAHHGKAGMPGAHRRARRARRPSPRRRWPRPGRAGPSRRRPTCRPAGSSG